MKCNWIIDTLFDLKLKGTYHTIQSRECTLECWLQISCSVFNLVSPARLLFHFLCFSIFVEVKDYDYLIASTSKCYKYNIIELVFSGQHDNTPLINFISCHKFITFSTLHKVVKPAIHVIRPPIHFVEIMLTWSIITIVLVGPKVTGHD